MNRKGEILKGNLIFIIILVIAVSLLFLFVQTNKNGASVWEDYYAKETTKIINQAAPGEEIILDINSATKIAVGNEVALSETFSFDNLNNEVCVKLSPRRKTCYKYFNDVDIIDKKINLASGSSSSTNTLSFKIIEVQKNA